jgi:hypothetical protein
MIEVNDSQLTAEDHAFIQQWAEALGVKYPGAVRTDLVGGT